MALLDNSSLIDMHRFIRLNIFTEPKQIQSGIFLGRFLFSLKMPMHSFDMTSGGTTPLSFKHTVPQAIKELVSCQTAPPLPQKSPQLHQIGGTILTSQNYPRATWTPRNSSRPPLGSAPPRSEASGTVLSAKEEGEKKHGSKRAEERQTSPFFQNDTESCTKLGVWAFHRACRVNSARRYHICSRQSTSLM